LPLASSKGLIWESNQDSFFFFEKESNQDSGGGIRYLVADRASKKKKHGTPPSYRPTHLHLSRSNWVKFSNGPYVQAVHGPTFLLSSATSHHPPSNSTALHGRRLPPPKPTSMSRRFVNLMVQRFIGRHRHGATLCPLCTASTRGDASTVPNNGAGFDLRC
jgi:hypothetical protein